MVKSFYGFPTDYNTAFIQAYREAAYLAALSKWTTYSLPHLPGVSHCSKHVGIFMILNWLVVSTPLKSMSSSIGTTLPYGKLILKCSSHHQPVIFKAHATILGIKHLQSSWHFMPQQCPHCSSLVHCFLQMHGSRQRSSQ